MLIQSIYNSIKMDQFFKKLQKPNPRSINFLWDKMRDLKFNPT